MEVFYPLNGVQFYVIQRTKEKMMKAHSPTPIEIFNERSNHMTNRLRFDELLSITENAELCAEEILSSIRSRVRSWTEKELDKLDTPSYYNFVREFPEYLHDAWRSTVEREIERTVESFESEKRGRVPRISKTIKFISSTFGLR